MTETGHPSRDLLLDVALGHAAADANSRVVLHLAECAPCRAAYDELHDGLERILPAAPDATAPPGLESKVLARLHAAETSATVVTRSRPPRRRFRTELIAAAACVLGIVMGGTSMYAYERSTSDQSSRSATPAEHAAELVTADGDAVGWAATGYDSDGPVLILTVDDGSPGKTYACRGVFEDRSTEVLAEWTLYDDQANIWVLDESERPLSALELVDDSGRVWAQAEW